MFEVESYFFTKSFECIIKSSKWTSLKKIII